MSAQHGQGSERSAARALPSRWEASLRLLAHPLTTGAFAVLAVNDHFLKARYPGVLTGKLSDVAGLFGVTVVLGALTTRPRIAAAVVSAAFLCLKVIPGVAELAVPLLGGAGLRDTTDLIALLVVPPAARWTGGRISVAREPRAREVLVATIGALSVVLTGTATSCLDPLQVDGFVTYADGTVFAHIKDSTFDEAGNEVVASIWAVSDDGGHSFSRAERPPTGEPSFADEACGRSSCYRIRDNSVERQGSDGAAWEPSFAYSREQRERMRLRDQGCGGGTEQFRAVAIVERPDGEHAVVAMGTQGVLHQTPDGVWERRAVLDRKPVSLNGPSWLSKLTLTPLLVVILGVAVLAAGWRRQGRARGVAGLVASVAGGLGLLSLAGGLLFFGVDYTIYGPAVALLSVVVFGLALALALSPGRQPDVPPPIDWPRP